MVWLKMMTAACECDRQLLTYILLRPLFRRAKLRMSWRGIEEMVRGEFLLVCGVPFRKGAMWPRASNRSAAHHEVV
jgi:hypothetical protein